MDAQSQNDRAIKNLRAAIQTARDAADRAEQTLSINSTNPLLAAQRVLAALAWGHANAFSGIETALAAIADANEIQLLTASGVLE